MAGVWEDEMNSRSWSIALFVLVALFCWTVPNQGIAQSKSSRFKVSFADSARMETTSGRIIVAFTRRSESFDLRNRGEGEIRFRLSETGTPFFGIDVEALKPDQAAFVDETVLGHPVRSLKDIPAGDYYVKGWLNVYTTFRRADGHVIRLHQDQGEGQSWQSSPGNLFSQPQKIHFDPAAGETYEILLDQVIPPITPPPDTEYVKHVKIQSKLLTEFWGQPMHIGATVLLPKGFNEHPEARYPVVYSVGHFSSRAPMGGASAAWLAEGTPRMLAVTIQHACPYYDDSYGVNSENCGPYGDAIVKELIPEVEKKFRAIGKPYARVLTGGSTGGWIALAQQVWYPDFFGGAWAGYPDQVDFRYYQIVNILQDANAYFIEHEWTRVPRPGNRRADGNIVYTMEQENLKEEVLGTRYRSGGQWAIWNAVFAPVAADGYPKPIWDPLTGKIDHEVAQWAKEHYDIRYRLEQNWSTLGPKLVGKIHVYCGRMDNYYLNEAVYKLEEFLESTTSPAYGGSFQWGARGGHGWSPFQGRNAQLKAMAEHIAKNAPAGDDVKQWQYK
jgi:hypothetical protein